MKYFQLVLLCLLCIAKVYGQAGSRSFGGVDVEITKEKKPERILTKVDITTAFPGGDSAWVKSVEERLNKTLKLKRKAKAGKYIASVRFLIERDGSVADIKCVNDPGFEICQQVRDVILRSTLGRWRPVADSDRRVREYHTSAIIFPPSSIKYKMDSVREFVPFPSSDLLPPEFTSSSARNEYYGESDSLSIKTFHRGLVFFLTLRSNCTFIYETFYKPYSFARIEFFIGNHKISGDTLSLSYESLLPSKDGKTYLPTKAAASWQLLGKPTYLLLTARGLSEPFEQRLKKSTSYVQIEGGQFDLAMSRCRR